jgi:hypothetical protein
MRAICHTYGLGSLFSIANMGPFLRARDPEQQTKYLINLQISELKRLRKYLNLHISPFILLQSTDLHFTTSFHLNSREIFITIMSYFSL